MSMRKSTANGTSLRIVGGLALALVVSGCAGANGELDDVYQPVHFYQKYPIEVKKGAVRLSLPATSAGLTPEQEDAVIRFAQGARSANAARIYIRRPRGRASADALAARITRIFTRQGLKPAMLSHATYPGAGPLVLSYSRYFASSPQCGNWPADVSRTAENESYENFGCAQQQNLAAMVANPKDLETPRAATPADSERRAKVLADYREPKDTATPVDENSKVKVSEVK